MLIAAGIAIQFDAIQTIVIGCLCGMLGQTNGTSAGTWGAALFAAVQIMVYVPVTLGYSMTVFMRGLRYSDIGIVSPLMVPLLLFLLHEIAIRALWAILRYRLQ